WFPRGPPPPPCGAVLPIPVFQEPPLRCLVRSFFVVVGLPPGLARLRRLMGLVSEIVQTPRVIESHFGESAPLSIGVEEELMVLDAETLLLSPRAAELIAASEGWGLPGLLKGELFASALELNTEICES